MYKDMHGVQRWIHSITVLVKFHGGVIRKKISQKTLSIEKGGGKSENNVCEMLS